MLATAVPEPVKNMPVPKSYHEELRDVKVLAKTLGYKVVALQLQSRMNDNYYAKLANFIFIRLKRLVGKEIANT